MGEFGGDRGNVAAAGRHLVGQQNVVEQARVLWVQLRGHRQRWEAAVNAPTDPLIHQLAQTTGLALEQWSAFLTALLRALADGLDEAWPAVLPTTGHPDSGADR